MRLSVIVPCHGNVADTRACVQSLLAQDRSLEILIVDNASPDETAELDRELPVRVLRQPSNLGFAGGVNAGLRAATGELLLVLNNDTLLAPGMLERLQRGLDSDPRIAFAAPVSNHVKGPARLEVGALGATEAGRTELAALLAEQGPGPVQDVETLAGLCLLARRTTVEQLGPLDERFGIGNYEDDDWCLRARLRGWRLVIVRDAFLHHHGHRTFRALGADYAAVLAEREARFWAKWESDPAGQALRAWRCGDLSAAAVAADAALQVHPAWPDAHWLLARWHAARNRPRAQAHLASFLATCPNHAGARLQAAALWLIERQDGQAAAELMRLRQCCHPTPAELAEWHATECRVRLEQQRPAAAVAAARAAIELEPQAAALHNLLGAALLAAGDVDRAEAAFRDAARLGDRDAAGNLGICAWRKGDPRAAVAVWLELLARDPRDAVARSHLEAVRAALAPA